MISSSGHFKSLADLITSDPSALEAIFAEISNGVTITNEKSEIIYVNPAFTSITGYEAKDMINGNPGMLHSGRHDKSFYEKMWADINTLGRWQGEIWNRHKSGKIIPELLTITKIMNHQHQIFYIGIFSDISNIIQKNKQQLNLAFHDPLTELCNRNLLEERFDMLKSEYQRNKIHYQTNKIMMVLLFCDLNHFKQINDTHGHLAGDKVLQFVASVFKKNSRRIDTVSRYGGDEFVVLLPKIKTKEEVENYCERIRDRLSQGVTIGELTIVPQLSIGASFFPAEAKKFDTLVANADKAMYHAKTNGLALTYYNTLEKD